MAAAPFSIKIFLAEGTPDGLRVVEKTNWTGMALCFSRTGYAVLRSREELTRPGVYVLIGPSDSERFRQRIYVGEADELHARLRQHAREKEFWTQAVAFTSKDEDLNKAHVRYLESKLLRLAQSAERSEVENTATPQPARLSAAEAAYADAFLADMLLIYPLVGVEAFEPLEARASSAVPRLYLQGKDTKAEGRETADGFLVFAGAVARLTGVPSQHSFYRDQRERLVADGVLVAEDGVLRLQRDHLFTAPSAAAAILLGRTSNGRQEWKDKNGRPLAEIQEAALGESGEISSGGPA